eukprot:scaffold7221_cov165-Amphora_coffeaeformis.AAC.5
MRACLLKAIAALSWLACLTHGFSSTRGISLPRRGTSTGSSTKTPISSSRRKQLPSPNFPQGGVGKEISLSSTGLYVIRYSDDEAGEHFFMRFAKECFETTKKAVNVVVKSTQEFIESPMGQQAIEKMRIATDQSVKKVSQKTKVVTQDLLENGFPDSIKEKAKEVIESPVSLPVGVMLGLALLPFFETLPQTLLSLAIFVYLIKFGRKIHAEKFPDEDTSTTDFSLLDKCSLGISATAGHTLVPAAHAHHAITTTASTTGILFPGATLALLGLVGVTCAFLFQKISVPFADVPKAPIARFVTEQYTTPPRPKPLKLTWEPQVTPEAVTPTPKPLYKTETFNSWDKELRSREE